MNMANLINPRGNLIEKELKLNRSVCSLLLMFDFYFEKEEREGM